MDEQLLLRIALISVILGLVVLFLITQRIELSATQINKIDGVNEDVLIKGVVTRVTDRGNLLFLEVTKPEKMTVIMFKDGVIDVEKGDAVEVIGRVDEFEGKEEIVANEVRIIG